MARKNLINNIMTAVKGIAYGFSRERNIKIQMVIGWLVVLFSLVLKIPRYDLILVVFVCFLVIVMELINTSFEKLIDFLHPDRHDEIRKIKDMMAGAVLLIAILAIIVGILVFYKPVLSLLKIL